MTIAEIYDKYKHLDKLLCDKRWFKIEGSHERTLPDNFTAQILYDLWQAIKESQEKEVMDDSKRA